MYQRTTLVSLKRVEDALEDGASLRAKIFQGYCHLVKTRGQQPAFHPKAGFEILDAGPHVFAIKRICPEQKIVALTNISGRRQSVAIKGYGLTGPCLDLLTGNPVDIDALELGPYQYRWLA